MLRIEKESKLYFDGALVNANQVNLQEFIIANLGMETTLGMNVTVEDLVHTFYPVREFIYQYFSEHYEVVRAFLTVTNLNRKFNKLRIYKTVTLENGYIYISVNAKLTPSIDEEFGVTSVSKIPLFIEEELEIADENIHLKGKTKFTLLELMSAIFDEFSYILKNDSIIAA
jgi:hypothetical protein